jgi:hypothetical protein
VADELVSIEGLDLEAAYGADFEAAPDATPDTEPTTPATAESDVTPPSQAEQEPGTTATPNPETLDVPGGNAAAAFKAYREEIAALKAERQAFQQQQEAARQQAEAQAFAAQLEELALTDPDRAAALLHQQQQLSAQRIAAQYEQQAVTQKAQLSVNYARRANPDFDAVVGALMASPQAQFINFAAIDASDDPGQALYDYAVSQRPVDRNALKAEILAELKQQQTPIPPKAPKSLDNLPTGAPVNTDVPQSHLAPKVAIDKMTPEQLQAWQARALRETS